MRMILNNGRTIRQGNVVEQKFAPEYGREVSTCTIHPLDMMELGIVDGERVAVESRTGSVVCWVRSSEEVRPGDLFLPYGPPSNELVPPGTHGTGMPDFKGIEVEVEPTEDPVLTIAEMLLARGGVPYVP